MGMYNYVVPECDLPDLPDGLDRRMLEWQTKDLEPLFLDTLRIRSDGNLEREEYDTEDRSDPNAEGLMRLSGMMTRVIKRWVPEKYTGAVNFSAYMVGNWRWIRYVAFFEDGKLFKLKLIKLEKVDEK